MHPSRPTMILSYVYVLVYNEHSEPSICGTADVYLIKMGVIYTSKCICRDLFFLKSGLVESNLVMTMVCKSNLSYDLLSFPGPGLYVIHGNLTSL